MGWGVRLPTAARIVSRVADGVSARIDRFTDRNNKFSRGMAREGFDGGYLAALNDVLLLLAGSVPNERHSTMWAEAMDPMRRDGLR